MKLQVNLSGSWRDVISFAEIDESAVKYLASELLLPEYMWRPV